MLRFLTNSLKKPNFKTTSLKNNKRKFSFVNYQNSSAPSVSNKLNEKLSFLRSEEEMRKYFNIVDWDKKECEEIVDRKFRQEKEEFSRRKREFKEFNREKLFKIAHDFKEKLEHRNKVLGKKDYQAPHEVLNYKNLKNSGFEYRNEFSLENVDFLKDKPKNYLIVSGIQSEDFQEVLNLLKSKGEIVKTNFIPDLLGRPSLLEVYYYTDEEAQRAKVHFHNYQYRQGSILRVRDYLDYNREKVDDRTIVIKNLDRTMKPQQLIEYLSNQNINGGHIVKLEMPMDLSNGAATRESNFFKIHDKYFDELEKSMNTITANTLVEKSKMKNKLNFYLTQINKLIKDFKVKLNPSENPEVNDNLVKNLLVEIKFFMSKFFPNEVINGLILPELEAIKEKNNLEEKIESQSTLVNVAYYKILRNLENFLKKYDDKLQRLARPLTVEEIPVDLFEIEEKNRKCETSADPERLDRNLIYENSDEKTVDDKNEVNTEFKKMNFFATFNPLEQQIAKLNFIRSLNNEEKNILKDKYGMDLSVNSSKFLDYFINFSKAIGIKVIDKYIELSNLYMSMSPLEKVYHGKTLARKILSEENRERMDQDERILRENLVNFLELRKLKTPKSVYHSFDTKAHFESADSTRYLNEEDDILTADINNMMNKKLPTITFNEVTSFYRNQNMYLQKLNYYKALIPINISKKKLLLEKIRARMFKYNEVLKEFLTNYELLPKDSILREKYDPEIQKLSRSIFGQVNSLEDVDLKVLDEEEDIGFDSKDKKKEAEAKNAADKKKKKKENFKRTEYKYTGEPLKENQIVNRLEYIKSNRDKIIESVLRITNNLPYHNRRFDKLSKQIENKLKDYINTVFKDNPVLQAHFLEKLKSKSEKFKYVKDNLEAKKYKLDELAGDIIERELNYTRKINYVKNYINNLENLMNEKLNKGNLIKALSVYEVFYNMGNKFNDLEYLKNTPRFYSGSPIIHFFANVKSIFEEEMNKVNVVREMKLKEINREENLSLDELQNKRTELIQDYANKIESYRRAIEMTESERKELEDSTKEDLENYKLQNLNLLNDEEILSHKEKLFYNELKKKEFELTQNKNSGKFNEEDYKDVSSLISNLNKLNSNQDNPTDYKGILDVLNNKKSKNRGYAFVTFATADEAKLFFLFNENSLKIKKSYVEVFPKFELTHEDVDEDLLHSRAKLESNIINRRSELIESEKKLKDFLQTFYDNLDSNEKHKEFETVREAFKDLYADPFKKHDQNNPFTQEEEEEIKYRAKLSGLDNTWLFEDDKIEKMRKIRDKRITKKYTEAEFLKRGIISEEFFRTEKEATKYEEKYAMIKDLSNSYFNSTENFELSNENDYTGKAGRRMKPIGTKEFIEKNLGRDYLDNTLPAFEKDKRESVIYEEIKELRNRFPKNKFMDDPQSGEDFIREVNSKFVNLLKEEDKLKINENAKEELLDRITNLSPMGKKIQMIINERNSKVQDEGVRQLTTIQNFYEKRIQNATSRDTMINEIPEDIMNAMIRNQFLFENTPVKEYPEFISEVYPPPYQPREEEVKEGTQIVEAEAGTKTEGDTSFRAFLQRRKAVIEKEAEQKKDQFDPNNLSIEEIYKAKDEVNRKLMNSINHKYKKYFSQIVKNITETGNTTGVYEFLQSKTENDKSTNNNDKVSNKLEKKIKEEKLNQKFLAELESNFSEELQTLPSFKEYFITLKNSVNHNANSDFNLADEPIFNYSKYAKDFKQSSNKKEDISLLYSSEKITPELFEKTFVKNQKAREERFKEWLSEKDSEELKRIVYSKQGLDMDLDDNQTFELLKAENPELFEGKNPSDISEIIEKYNESLRNSEWLEQVQNLEDKDEVEYYFNPDCGETIEEHLAALSKTKFNKVSVRTDNFGRFIIRREYKHNYKYDLDEIMQYDIKRERERMLKKLENFDFKSDLEANVEYYSQFYQLVNQNDCFNQNLNDLQKNVSLIIQKVEDYQKLSYDNFSFDDFKRLTDNLLQMKPRSLTNFVNHVIRLINLVSNQTQNENYQEISAVLKEISEFSQDIFNEREVRIFVDLIKTCFNNKFNEKVKEFDNLSKFYFIQNVLLKEFFQSLKNILTNKETIYVYGILKLLPIEGINLNLSSIKVIEAKPKLKKILWKNYKQYMLKEFNILKKKEKEIKPNSFLEVVTEQHQIFNELKNETQENITEIEKEIDEFGNKLKNYYIELANASK